MVSQQVELWQIDNQLYVTATHAALYLGVSVRRVDVYGNAGRLKTRVFENRVMVEWESLLACENWRQMAGGREKRRKPVKLKVADSSRDPEYSGQLVTR